jgi:PAS domain S-box-containing protein
MAEASAFAPGSDDPALYRTLFAAYPDGLIVCDAAGKIVAANPAAAELLGFAADELIGRGVESLVPDAVRSRHAAFRQRYGSHPVARPMGTQMELVAKRRDGSEVMVEIALSPLASHGLPLVVAAIRGIGAYPRVQQALQRARYAEHLAQIGRLAVDSRDPHALIDLARAIAAEALQLDRVHVDLFEPQPRPGAEAAAPAPQAGPHAITVPLIDRGRAIGRLVLQAHVPGRLGTEEQRFAESLAALLATSVQRAQSEEALNHAARLESVGQLTGGIAHDFNNLLTVIQGNLQVLEERPACADDPQARPLLDAAMRAARRGAELTGKLLAFSRRQVLDPTTVNLHTLIGSLADMLRRTLDQRIAIEVDVAANCPAVRADPGQLESALLNIAINARDAMPSGGILRFRASPCESLPNAARDMLDAAERDAGAGHFVAIEIADTGIGMSDAVRERAFEPFFTTKEVGRGTGLGLSTVYGFVRQSHGAVTLGGALGHGTVLTLYVPKVTGEAARPVGAAAEAAHRPPPGLRVLLVEDDAEVRAVALAFLEALECEVGVAANGEQALALLAPAGDGAAPFELLLTDIALGAGMRGTELAARARALHPGIAVLLVSGFSEELLAADRDAPPDWELLPKPYSRDELARAIARAAAARSS